MTWLLLLVACEQFQMATAPPRDFEAVMPEGETLVITDTLDNTVKSISRGVMLEAQKSVVERTIFDGGVLGEEAIAYRDAMVSFRVEHAYGGDSHVWDSTSGDKPPKELAGYATLPDRVTDVAIGEDGAVKVREGGLEALESEEAEGVKVHEGREHLDVVTLGLLGRPSGPVRLGQRWTTVASNDSSLRGLESGAQLTMNWQVVELGSTTATFEHSLSMKSGMTGRGDEFSVSGASGSGKLVVELATGLPSEYSETVRYQLNSADETAEQTLSRLRYYKVK